jgi:hypothetical protein
MGQAFRSVVLVVGVGAVLSVGLIVTNQTAQAVQLASTIHPNLGTVTLWSLVVVYASVVGMPVVLFLRLPKSLTPPSKAEGSEFDSHLKKLGERLATSPHLKGRDLSDQSKIEQAIADLGEKVNAIVKESAMTVFLSTAVSQSGRLDGLLVMAAQSRMVWRIAHLYGQRPGPGDIARLYGTVAASVFVASEIDDIDLEEQVEPILSSAMGALGASVPGLQVAGTILANCVLSGSANAFLTLRVGMVAKRYCGATVLQKKSVLRREATAEAASALGKIVSEGTSKLSGAIWKASVNKFGDAVSGASDYAKGAGSKLWAKVRRQGFEPQSEVG